MRVHVNHHGLYSLACFLSALSASLRPAAARRQHTLLRWQLNGRRTTIQSYSALTERRVRSDNLAASDRSIRLSEFAKAELSDYREKRSANQYASQ